MVGLPTDAVKFVIRGTIAGSQDWSTGIWLGVAISGGSWGVSNQLAVTVDWRAFAGTWWGSLKGFASADCEFVGVSTYFYPAGSLVATELAASDLTSPVVGTGGIAAPTQSCLVASLRSDIPGRSGRGRSYFPFIGQALNSDHQASSANCTSLANAYVALLQALNGYAGSAHGLTAQSCSVASFTKARLSDITNVVVNSKIDTQRRREDKIPTTATISVPV